MMLTKQTILIFGSGGFIGRELVEKLEAEGNILLLATRKDTKSTRNSVSYLNTDLLISREAVVRDMLKGVDIVINCAGEVTDESRMYETNVTFVGRVMDMVEFAGIRRFIHLGSAGIYRKKGIISVSSDIAPENYYEETKWEADQLILARTGRINSQIIRPTSVVGNRMRNQSFIQLLRLYKKAGFISISNSRKTYFHYVPVETVVEAVMMCVKGVLKESAYLVATDLTQKAFINCLPKKIRRIYIPYFLLMPFVLLKLSGLSKARIMHLRDKCHFVSNIEKFNQESYKSDVLKRVIKSFDIF